MKYSIRKQFAYIFIGLMVGKFYCAWFINTFLKDIISITNRR